MAKGTVAVAHFMGNYSYVSILGFAVVRNLNP